MQIALDGINYEKAMKIDKEIIDNYTIAFCTLFFLIGTISACEGSWVGFIIGVFLICGFISIIFYIREIWSKKE